MKLYIRLFHGRKDPKEQLDDWGSDGPILGPFDFVHTTYACAIKMGDNDHEMIELRVVGDMVYYDGVYYGDWTVCTRKVFREDGFKKFERWNAEKAKVPSGS